MTNKSITLYVLIGIAGLALLFLSRQYQAKMNKENEKQLQALQQRINLPRKKIPVVADPLNKKIEAARENIKIANEPESKKKQRANIEKSKEERERYLRTHKIQFPADPRAMYLVGKTDLLEMGVGGSYTLGLYVKDNSSVAQVKNQILQKLNVTSDELEPVSFTPNAANGFRNQSLYEVESGGLYHMFFFASHPFTSNMVIMHFTIKNMTRVIEQYIDKRYKQLRAAQ